MSRTTVRAPFAGQDRTFRLRLGEIGELERLCSAGIGEIMMRLASHRFRAADIRDTIRLGLEGGGLFEPDATALVMRYLDDEPIGEHLNLAADILTAAVSGVPQAPKRREIGEEREPGDLASFIGIGAAIGFSPEQVKRSTLSELTAAIEGYAKVHAPKREAETPDDAEYLAVLADEITAGRA